MMKAIMRSTAAVLVQEPVAIEQDMITMPHRSGLLAGPDSTEFDDLPLSVEDVSITAVNAQVTLQESQVCSLNVIVPARGLGILDLQWLDDSEESASGNNSNVVLGSGVRIRAGERVRIQVHATGVGNGEADSGRCAIVTYLYPAGAALVATVKELASAQAHSEESACP